MKHLSILFAFLMLCASAFAQQTVTPDARLLETFEAEYLMRLQRDNPVLLDRLNYYLEHAWYLTEYPEEKGDPGLETIEVPDLENIQIFALEKKYELARDFERRMKYRIAGTSFVLVYYSGKEFNQRFQEARRID